MKARTKRAVAYAAAITALVAAAASCNAITGLDDDYRDCSAGDCRATDSGSDASADAAGETDADAHAGPDARDGDAADSADVPTACPFDLDASADVQEGATSADYATWPLDYDAGPNDAGRFVVLGNLVSDSLTQMKWEKDGAQYASLAEAEAHCASLGLLWHVPRRIELITLLQPSLPPAYCMDPLFDLSSSNLYASSTPALQEAGASDASRAYWGVLFQSCGVVPVLEASGLYVRCVHD